MKFTLKANATNFIAIDEKVATTDEKTTVEVIANFPYERLVLSVVSPNGKRRYDASAPMDITASLKTPGKVSMELFQYVGAEIVKKWTVEPFIVKENDDGKYKPVPQIEELRGRIDKNDEQISLLKQAVSELYKLLTER